MEKLKSSTNYKLNNLEKKLVQLITIISTGISLQINNTVEAQENTRNTINYDNIKASLRLAGKLCQENKKQDTPCNQTDWSWSTFIEAGQINTHDEENNTELNIGNAGIRFNKNTDSVWLGFSGEITSYGPIGTEISPVFHTNVLFADQALELNADLQPIKLQFSDKVSKNITIGTANIGLSLRPTNWLTFGTGLEFGRGEEEIAIQNHRENQKNADLDISPYPDFTKINFGTQIALTPNWSIGTSISTNIEKIDENISATFYLRWFPQN